MARRLTLRMADALRELSNRTSLAWIPVETLDSVNLTHVALAKRGLIVIRGLPSPDLPPCWEPPKTKRYVGITVHGHAALQTHDLGQEQPR